MLELDELGGNLPMARLHGSLKFLENGKYMEEVH